MDWGTVGNFVFLDGCIIYGVLVVFPHVVCQLELHQLMQIKRLRIETNKLSMSSAEGEQGGPTVVLTNHNNAGITSAFTTCRPIQLPLGFSKEVNDLHGFHSLGFNFEQ